MFSRFEQLPQEIQREILLYCPNSLPQILCVSRNINRLIGDDIYKYFHIGPTNKEITAYLESQPSMFFNYSFNNESFEIFLMCYTNNHYVYYDEKAKYDGDSIDHSKQSAIARLENNKIVSNYYFAGINVSISLDDKDGYDLKTEQEIYQQRTSYIKRDPLYAYSKIWERLDQIYNKYRSSENINLLFLFYYLNHNKAVFLNLDTQVMHYTSYLTCRDFIPIGNNGAIPPSWIQYLKSDVDTLYSEIKKIITNLR